VHQKSYGVHDLHAALFLRALGTERRCDGIDAISHGDTRPAKETGVLDWHPSPLECTQFGASTWILRRAGIVFCDRAGRS